MRCNKHVPTNRFFAFNHFFGTQGTKEGIIRENFFFYTDNTNLPESDIIPSVTFLVYENSYSLASNNDFLMNPQVETMESHNTLSSMDYYTQQLAKREFQKEL